MTKAADGEEANPSLSAAFFCLHGLEKENTPCLFSRRCPCFSPRCAAAAGDVNGNGLRAR